MNLIYLPSTVTHLLGFLDYIVVASILDPLVLGLPAIDHIQILSYDVRVPVCTNGYQ